MQGKVERPAESGRAESVLDAAAAAWAVLVTIAFAGKVLGLFAIDGPLGLYVYPMVLLASAAGGALTLLHRMGDGNE